MYKYLKKELKMKNSTSIILALGIFLGLASLGCYIEEAITSMNQAQRTVVVKGLAEKEVLADSVVWPVVFRVNAASLDELYASIAVGNGKIQDYLQKNGIDAKEINVIAPAIEDKNLYSSEGNKPIYNFSALCTITVNSKKVKKIAELSQSVADLVKDGIAIDSQYARIAYSFTSLNALKPAMIENATKNARDVAQKFAKDSESNLGKIKKANQGLFSVTTPDNYQPEIMKVRVVSTVEYYLID